MGVETERRRNCGATESSQWHAGLFVPRTGACTSAILWEWPTQGR